MAGNFVGRAASTTPAIGTTRLIIASTTAAARGIAEADAAGGDDVANAEETEPTVGPRIFTTAACFTGDCCRSKTDASENFTLP